MRASYRTSCQPLRLRDRVAVCCDALLKLYIYGIARWIGLDSALALGAVGCSGVETSGGSDAAGGSNPLPAPTTRAFAGGGQAAEAKRAYPAGPHGINAGSFVEDFEFVGYQNPSIKNDEMQTIRATCPPMRPTTIARSARPRGRCADSPAPTSGPSSTRAVLPARATSDPGLGSRSRGPPRRVFRRLGHDGGPRDRGPGARARDDAAARNVG